MKTEVAVGLAALLVVGSCVPVSSRRDEALPDELKALPIVVFPVASPARTMALVMSGDGNWASFVRELADTLVAAGVPVVGLESRTYLARPKTPREVTDDLEPVLRHYLSAWSVDSVLVVGYSRGADLAPFLVNRLAPDLRGAVSGVALISPGRTASFQFHVTDLLWYIRRGSDVSTQPEVDELSPLPVLCVYGVRDKDALCPLLDGTHVTVVGLPAGHRLHDVRGVSARLFPLIAASPRP